MSKRPWMPVYVGDFTADTMHLNDAATGAYFRLLMHCWQHGRIPIENNASLRMIAHSSSRNWPRVSTQVVPLFVADGTHKRVSQELHKAAEISSKRKAAAEQKHARKRANAHANAHTVTVTKKENSQSKKTESVNGKGTTEEASNPTTPEADLFRRGKEVLGPKAGGLIATLLKAKKGVRAARAAIEEAATKSDPREYVGACIAGGMPSANGRPRQATEYEQWVQNNTEYYGTDNPELWGRV